MEENNEKEKLIDTNKLTTQVKKSPGVFVAGFLIGFMIGKLTP